MQEYLSNDLAAVGIRLDNGDQHAIHWMFSEYTRMKRSVNELDDVDVAQILRQSVGEVWRKQTGSKAFKVSAIYIDEAQDFSPAEFLVVNVVCSVCVATGLTRDDSYR